VGDNGDGRGVGVLGDGGEGYLYGGAVGLGHTPLVGRAGQVQLALSAIRNVTVCSGEETAAACSGIGRVVAEVESKGKQLTRWHQLSCCNGQVVRHGIVLARSNSVWNEHALRHQLKVRRYENHKVHIVRNIAS